MQELCGFSLVFCCNASDCNWSCDKTDSYYYSSSKRAGSVLRREFQEGYIDNTIEHTGNDELGVLADSFRTTCKGLHIVVSDLTYLLDEMAKGNFDIRTKAEEVYKGILNRCLHRSVR